MENDMNHKASDQRCRIRDLTICDPEMSLPLDGRGIGGSKAALPERIDQLPFLFPKMVERNFGFAQRAHTVNG